LLAWEHTARQRTTYHDAYQPWEGYAVNESPHNKDDDDYHVVKVEAGVAMEDAAPPRGGNVPPEYQALVASGYDEEPLLQ
jgi:hypothetical protein